MPTLSADAHRHHDLTCNLATTIYGFKALCSLLLGRRSPAGYLPPHVLRLLAAPPGVYANLPSPQAERRDVATTARSPLNPKSQHTSSYKTLHSLEFIKPGCLVCAGVT